jgi:hypothetical protein
MSNKRRYKIKGFNTNGNLIISGYEVASCVTSATILFKGRIGRLHKMWPERRYDSAQYFECKIEPL